MNYRNLFRLFCNENKTVLLFILIQFSSFGQNNVSLILDSIVARAKETSLYTNTIDWDSLEQKVQSKAVNATTIQELKPALETLLNGLKDHHGKVINANDYSYLAWFTDNMNSRNPDTREFKPETWEIVNDTTAKFEYKLLKGRIGYLKIVGIGPQVDVEQEAKKIRESIIFLSGRKVNKWIIDLRYNGGGNMNPMMAGIAPLVGEGIVGGLVNLENEKLFNWEIKSSNFYYGGYQSISLPDLPKFNKNPKIAVLTSRWTASSGEIVATTLKGRPNTKFFGEATGGYTTNNGWDIINDEVILVISTGIFCDRNGIAYEKNIPVDVEIPFVVVSETEKDACVSAAKNWLKKK